MGLDVTERETLQEKLDFQAGHDRLTGLPNRILLPELLAEALERTAGAGEKIAVLALDIDRFSRMNDMYGIRVGDECLRRIAEIISTRMRSMDIIARTGGDEFAIVMTGIKSALSAEQAVRDLTQAFEEPLIVEGYKIQLPINIGVALGPEEGIDALALWRGAESARTQAAAAGSGRAFWFSTELRKSAEEQESNWRLTCARAWTRAACTWCISPSTEPTAPSTAWKLCCAFSIRRSGPSAPRR